MDDLIIPSNVVDDELLDRVAFEPSFFYEGKLSIAAFALRNGKAPETYLSVLRDSYCNIEDEVMSFKKRSNGDMPVGYAQLETKQIRQIKSMDPAQVVCMDVLNRSTESRPSHAGIFAMVNDKLLTGEKDSHTSPIALYIQSKLLKISTYYTVKQKEAASPVEQSSSDRGEMV